MTRTTIDLDPAVLQELRRRSALESRSMGAVASELLAGAIARDADVSARPFAWTSADLGVAAIDIEDAEAVRRA